MKTLSAQLNLVIFFYYSRNYTHADARVTIALYLLLAGDVLTNKMIESRDLENNSGGNVIDLISSPVSDTSFSFTLRYTPVTALEVEAMGEQEIVGEEIVKDEEMISTEVLQKEGFGVEDNKSTAISCIPDCIISKEHNITIRKMLAKTVLERIDLNQKYTKEVFTLQALRAVDKLVLLKAKEKEESEKPLHVRLWQQFTTTTTNKVKKSLQKVVQVCTVLKQFYL